MSRSLKDKLRNLENCVLPKVEPESTKIDILSMPESEQKLFKKCFDIKEWVEHSDYEPTERDMRILTTATNRLTLRVIDVFTTYLKGLFRVDLDNGKAFILKARFWYFMFELARHMEQIDKETELTQKHPKDFDAFSKEMEEWKKQQENQTPLWTRESFSYWFSDTTDKVQKYVKSKDRQK